MGRSLDRQVYLLIDVWMSMVVGRSVGGQLDVGCMDSKIDG